MVIVLLTGATYTLARILAYAEQTKAARVEDEKEAERLRRIAALYGKDQS